MSTFILKKTYIFIDESGKPEWYQIIKDKIGKIQDICNKKYFTQSNPLQLSI